MTDWPVNNLIADDVWVRITYLSVVCAWRPSTHILFFQYALDRNSAFVMLSSMQVAIAVASLYDVTISATESQFGQKANCINNIELRTFNQMGPAINLLMKPYVF